MNDPHHLPPFTKALLDFAKEARDDFCTPGHHSGALFEEIPEGRAFVRALGEGAFTADISDSSSVIGDPSSHEASPERQKPSQRAYMGAIAVSSS